MTFRESVRGAPFLELLDVMVGKAATVGLVASPFEQKHALPYDLHLADAGGQTIMGSITSEDDAWVEMSKPEWRELVRGTRRLRRIRVRADRS